MVDLEEIKTQVLCGKPLEKILEKFNWKEFEKIVAEIFRSNGFIVKENFRFKNKKRYEIDLIAARNNFIFCVDCKEWSGGRYKKSGLKYAIDKQNNRLKELKKFSKKNPVAKSLLTTGLKDNFFPLVVTLLEEDMIENHGCFIVPVWKLNGFLLKLEEYL